MQKEVVVPSLKRPELLSEVNGRTRLLARLWREDEGQDLIEYGLLVALLALSAIAALGPLAAAISTVFSSAAGNLTSNS